MAQIVVLDAGGQYCHLIARKVRELGVSTEVRPMDGLRHGTQGVRGVVVSGGPGSVYDPKGPKMDPALLTLGVPILGICYGHQLLARHLGADVRKGDVQEFGPATAKILKIHPLFDGVTPRNRQQVWMSHGDTVHSVPPGFEVLVSTRNCPVASFAVPARKAFGIQFHPEVAHTPCGQKVLRNFVFRIAGCKPDWDPHKRLRSLLQSIRKQAQGKRVFFLVSGGVDSTTAYALCARSLRKDQLQGLYVDTGFMRKGETDELAGMFHKVGLTRITYLDASDRFFAKLTGVVHPEEKRIIIGHEFVRVEEEFFRTQRPDNRWLLGQGTIYPDTIESGGTRQSDKIKTHHNRVEGIRDLLALGRVLEPLSEFYKDEVRTVAKDLGLPKALIERHPFPGPGLAIRCLCSARQEEVETAEEIIGLPHAKRLRAYRVPIQTVGVQGDRRTYAHLGLMMGPYLPRELEEVAGHIPNTVKGVNRVAYWVAPDSKTFPKGEFRVKRASLTRERVDLLREADDLVNRFVRKYPFSKKIWQFPIILVPFGRKESNGETVVLRPVSSVDAMTAEYVKFPKAVLFSLAKRILGIPGIDAVFYDVTNKPPGTIEWE